MSTISRRRIAFAGITGVSLASAGLLAPGALAANTIDGDVSVTNTETVQVLMSASGKVHQQRVYEQLVLRGDGKVDIANPVSTKGLRNLNGFGGFDVQDGQQRIKTDVDGTKKFRSVSDYTKSLPIDIDITYTFDGEEVEPGDIVGKAGDLVVRYLVTNTTGVTQEVTYQDSKGRARTKSEEVVTPMVGSLTTVLPSTFTKVKSAEANAAGDGRGGTQLSFTMTLIPPIGKSTAEFGYEARISDGVIPKASVSVLPVNPLESPSFKGGAASYKGGADTGQDLTAGATEIDANVLKLRDGANDLVAGILQLSEGANTLTAGLRDTAAPGAGKLAVGAKDLDAGAGQLAGGTGDLRAGAGKLDAGAGKLSNGLKDARSGAPALLDGVSKLRAGAQKVDAGLVTLRDTVNGGGAQFNSEFGAAVDGAMTSTLNGIVPSLNGALDALNALVQASDATAMQKGTFAANVDGTKAGLKAGIEDALKNRLAPQLKDGAAGGVKKITDGVAGGVGAPATPDTLRNGVAQIIGGLDQLSDKGGDLIDGLGQLSAGANKLSAGTGDLKAGAGELNAGAGALKDGTGQLSAGAGTLAEGLGSAAEGSGKIADGLDKAAASAPALPRGAERLSKEGTSVLVGKGNATAVDYGLKYGLIEAGALRAASAQPYGSPDGATALTAYKFEIAGENGADSANMKRGIAALVLLAAAGVFATVRRRGLIWLS